MRYGNNSGKLFNIFKNISSNVIMALVFVRNCQKHFYRMLSYFI